MARAKRSARGRSSGGGGAGQIVTVLIIVGLLGGLAWFGWSRMNKDTGPKIPTGPRVTVSNWAGRYGLRGDIPDPLPNTWRFAFRTKWLSRKAGEQTQYPSAWVDVQLEEGRFTGIQIAKYSRADRAGPYGLLEEEKFASSSEGKQVRGFIRELADKPGKCSIEKEAGGLRFFGWKNPDKSAIRSSLVCVARKGSAEALRMYQKAKTDWELGIGGVGKGTSTGKTKFDVMLVSFDKKNREKVLAALCEALEIKADVAGTLVDNAPHLIKAGVDRTRADAIKRTLEAAGAKVKVK